MINRWVALPLSALASVLLMVAAPSAEAAIVPTGFTDQLITNGLSNPTAMQFAPDGRLFVCEQDGALRLIKNGALLSAPFMTLAVNSIGERGLLGVAFDPQFQTNHFLYVYYTTESGGLHNRVSRFTANGDVVVPGSEFVVMDLEPLSASNHNGGALHFGLDGMLYVAVGENAVSSNSQTLANRLGKMLRINADGSIPSDNPFFNMATGANRAIWALGLRNPFTFAFLPGTTVMFINDVGQNTWEEINEGSAGANYGWPASEGPTNVPGFVGPRSAYSHADGCAITGGAFYKPSTVQFPSEYVNDYFFADLCGGWIRKLDPLAGNSVVTFASGISAPVDLKVASDGTLYYLARGTNSVHRVVADAPAPPPLPGADYRLYWQHDLTGNLAVWNMDGTGLVNGQAVSPSEVSDVNWKIVGTSDFNSDGHQDLFWRNQFTGVLAVWYMNQTTFSSAGVLANAVSDPAWTIGAIADVNNDAHPDIVWHHQITGSLVVWYLNNTTFLGSALLSPSAVSPVWRLVGTADFNNDSKTDLLWQNSQTGSLAVWLMSNTTFLGPGVVSNDSVSDTNWKIKIVRDVDGNGRADFIWQNQSTGALVVWFMNGTTYLSGYAMTPGSVSDLNWRLVGAG